MKGCGPMSSIMENDRELGIDFIADKDVRALYRAVLDDNCFAALSDGEKALKKNSFKADILSAMVAACDRIIKDLEEHGKVQESIYGGNGLPYFTLQKKKWTSMLMQEKVKGNESIIWSKIKAFQAEKTNKLNEKYLLNEKKQAAQDIASKLSKNSSVQEILKRLEMAQSHTEEDAFYYSFVDALVLLKNKKLSADELETVASRTCDRGWNMFYKATSQPPKVKNPAQTIEYVKNLFTIFMETFESTTKKLSAKRRNTMGWYVNTMFGSNSKYSNMVKTDAAFVKKMLAFLNVTESTLQP